MNNATSEEARPDPKAPIRYVSYERFQAYFDSLSPDRRWRHPDHNALVVLWHWEMRSWWSPEEQGGPKEWFPGMLHWELPF